MTANSNTTPAKAIEKIMDALDEAAETPNMGAAREKWIAEGKTITKVVYSGTLDDRIKEARIDTTRAANSAAYEVPASHLIELLDEKIHQGELAKIKTDTEVVLANLKAARERDDDAIAHHVASLTEPENPAGPPAWYRFWLFVSLCLSLVAVGLAVQTFLTLAK